MSFDTINQNRFPRELLFFERVELSTLDTLIYPESAMKASSSPIMISSFYDSESLVGLINLTDSSSPWCH